jgi:hypothetical protein
VHGPVRQRVVDLIANRPDGITRGELIESSTPTPNLRHKDFAYRRLGSAVARATDW